MLYFFTGDDEFAVEQVVRSVTAEQQIDPLHFSRFQVNATTSVDEIISELLDALTFALDGNLKLLWLRGLPLNSTLPNLAAVYPYFQALNEPDSPSILVISTSAVDGRLALSKWLKANAECQECWRIASWNTEALLAQVQAAAAQAGLRLSPAAAQALVRQVGNDTRLLYQAVDLLVLHSGGQQTRSMPGPKLIERLIPAQCSNGIGFARALLARDVATATVELERILLRQEPALKLVALTLSQVRLWIKVKAAVSAMPNAANPRIAEVIGLSGNPNRLYYLRQEVGAISLEMLVGLLKLVVATEKVLKSGSGRAREERALRDLVLAVGKAS